MQIAEHRRSLDYNVWANARIVDACARLSADQWTKDLGTSFPSIRDTVGHIVAVEWVWLRRWKGESPRALPDWAVAASVQSLRTKLDEVEAERAAFVETLVDADLPRRIAYINLKGEPWEYSLGDMLVHLVNHSTYHRGQVSAMCRQVGAAAPPTDFLVFEDGKQR